MRLRLIVALSAGLVVPAAAQDLAAPDGIVIDDPALAEGLEAMPQPDDIVATVEAENAEASPAVAPETLAEMQAALRAVASDLQTLRAELLASGATGFEAAGGDSAIDRMNAMEAQIARLTDQTEQLSNRIKRVVADGTNRIGDIEFRLCEMDPNCDLGALMTAELGRQGGGAMPADISGVVERPSDISAQTLPPMEDPVAGTAPPTEEEAREFASARRAVEAGEWQKAIEELDHLTGSHAGGPLTAEALYLKGIALEANGQVEPAAEAWLTTFAAAPDGPRAAASLLALSRAMIALNTPADACPHLAELARRFPNSPEAADAASLSADSACPQVAEQEVAN
ncbi:tetratricopeptide repeat protein [Paracoccus albus]|uniref:tetratricopeptide repeat protein n=1 Tax=Paracoccus albus TaxID=3017784 RepID=UPI0022F07E80|nr:tetratricopeptide repeat protein [Paracoccus albus]WBU60329.1 tetratricopeptide repeat protein [Paracoccus albus]